MHSVAVVYRPMHSELESPNFSLLVIPLIIHPTTFLPALQCSTTMSVPTVALLWDSQPSRSLPHHHTIVLFIELLVIYVTGNLLRSCHSHKTVTLDWSCTHGPILLTHLIAMASPHHDVAWLSPMSGHIPSECIAPTQTVSLWLWPYLVLVLYNRLSPHIPYCFASSLGN